MTRTRILAAAAVVLVGLLGWVLLRGDRGHGDVLLPGSIEAGLHEPAGPVSDPRATGPAPVPPAPDAQPPETVDASEMRHDLGYRPIWLGENLGPGEAARRFAADLKPGEYLIDYEVGSENERLAIASIRGGQAAGPIRPEPGRTLQATRRLANGMTVQIYPPTPGQPALLIVRGSAGAVTVTAEVTLRRDVSLDEALAALAWL